MQNPFKSTVEGIRSGMMNEPGVVDKIYDKPISLIHEDPSNPRSSENHGYAEDTLRELADDIKVNGLINAIVVREHPTIKGEWQIISGHRRFRASKLAGLTSVPVRISKNKDYKSEQIAENLHREDLSVGEMSNIISEFVSQGLTSYQISQKLHKSQSFVAQHMNILKAPACVKKLVDCGLIRNAMQGSELTRAYREHPRYTEEHCDIWVREKIEPTLSMIKDLRRSAELTKKREEQPAIAETEEVVQQEEVAPEPKLITRKRKKMLRRYVQIRAVCEGLEGFISLDRTPSYEGSVWFTPDGSADNEAYEVSCTNVKIIWVAERR